MKKAGLMVGAAETSSDLRYATGLRTPDPIVCVRVGKTYYAVLSALEYDRGLHMAKKNVEILASDACGGNSLFAQIVFLAEKFGIGEFSVPCDFPLGLADALRTEGLAVTPAQGIFLPEREFKTEAEVELIEQAMRVTESGMARAVAVVGESGVDNDGRLRWNGEELTSERLRREIDLELLRGGGFSDSTIVAGGRQSAEPHNQGSGVLYAHKPIVIDIFPKMLSSGYCGDLTRTLCKGAFEPIAKKAYHAVVAARDTAKTAVRAGAIPCNIHNLAAKIMADAGFETVIRDGVYRGFYHGLGHGVGLDIHEAPRLSTGVRKPLKGGEIVTVEPGLYYPEWGGIRMEDIVFVEQESCRCLTRIGDPGEID